MDIKLQRSLASSRGLLLEQFYLYSNGHFSTDIHEGRL
jgi:hypothetical protein